VVRVVIPLTVLTSQRRPFSSVKSITIIKIVFAGFLVSLRNMVTMVGTSQNMERRLEVPFYLYVMGEDTVAVIEFLSR
jgi:hypothetical protein